MWPYSSFIMLSDATTELFVPGSMISHSQNQTLCNNPLLLKSRVLVNEIIRVAYQIYNFLHATIDKIESSLPIVIELPCHCLSAGLLVMQVIHDFDVCIFCLLAGSVGAQAGLDIQRQQLPFGELVFQAPEMYQFEWVNNSTVAQLDGSSSLDGLKVDLPKIRAMIDRHTDDGSVISRHYSATLVESAWRNRINNSTMAYLVESTVTDVNVLSFFSVCYLSSVIFMAASRRKHLV